MKQHHIGYSGIAAAALWSAAAIAYPPYMTAWENRYPTSTLPVRMEALTGNACYVCHSPPSVSAPGNCYRTDFAILLEAGLDVDPAIEQLHTVDSDGDGVPNGEEATMPHADFPGEVGYNMGLIGDLGTDPCADDPDQPVTGVAETPPVVCGNDADCDDGLFCNGAELCTDGLCVPSAGPCEGAWLECDDVNDQCVCAEQLTLERLEPFVTCLAGPGTTAGTECDCPDTDLDGDIDLADFASLQARYTGEP